ncbi:MAG: PQQ-dependent sugar dehydrogenase [Deltaproteobacteria bacterium]|nr:PQQ-dependent sugar dehydrogenase [Deltaproteobacteria bacterium]
MSASRSVATIATLSLLCSTVSPIAGCGSDPAPGAPQSGGFSRGDGIVGPPTITRAVAGEDQRAEVGTAVAIPPRMLVTDADGDPVPGVAVEFVVREGEGIAEGARAVTGADGTAAVGAWRLGPVRGRNVIVGEVAGLAPVQFVAEGTPNQNGSMVVVEGDGQYARVGQPVERPPSVLVRDRDDKPIANRKVTFVVTKGGGTLASADVTTDAEGRASTTWTLGTTPGENTLRVESERLPPLTLRATAVSDEDPSLVRDVVLGGLSVPWDIAFAPDGTMLFSQRGGQLRILRPGATAADTLLTPPADLDVQSQSGMLGIALDPSFATNRYLYVYMSSRADGPVDNRVRRFVVAPDWSGATFDRDILKGISWGSAGGHSGGRLRFGPDGNLWLTTGDTRSATVPQSLTALGGKVIRITRDGAAAPGNPGLGPGNVVYALGFRNPQGIAFRPTDGAPFICEHGPNQDDEVTRLAPGGNGGWNPNDGAGNYNGYSGAVMTDRAQFPAALPPTLVVADSAGMSGCDFVSGSAWRSWDGRLVIGMLAGRRLVSARPDAAGTGTSAGPTDAFANQAQFRAVVRGPDGNLYIATNGAAPNDQIWRVRSP